MSVRRGRKHAVATDPGFSGSGRQSIGENLDSVAVSKMLMPHGQRPQGFRTCQRFIPFPKAAAREAIQLVRGFFHPRTGHGGEDV